jgi:hypothetical protein
MPSSSTLWFPRAPEPSAQCGRCQPGVAPITCMDTLSGPRNVADPVRTTTTAFEPAMRNAWLVVSVIVPFAVVPHCVQRTRVTGAAPFQARIRRDAVGDPPSDGTLSFQVSDHRDPSRGTAVARRGTTGPLRASTPLKRPAAVVPATGPSRAWTRSTNVGTAAAALPHTTAAAASPMRSVLVPAVLVLVTTQPPDLGGTREPTPCEASSIPRPRPHARSTHNGTQPFRIGSLEGGASGAARRTGRPGTETVGLIARR